MSTTAINRSNPKRTPAKNRDILGYKWIDSAFSRMTSFEATLTDVQNRIDSSTENEATKARQRAYLNKIIHKYQSFLPEPSEAVEPAEPVANEPKSYSPAQLRFSFENLLTSGHAAAERFLQKLDRQDVLAFLNDGTGFDGIKAFVGSQPGYRKAYQEAKALHYGVHIDSLPAYNALRLRLEQNTYTPAENYAYYEILKPYFHEADRGQMEARVLAKLGDYAPVASEPTQEAKTPLQRTVDDVMRRSQFHVKVDPHMVRAAEIIGKLSPDWSETALIRLYFIVRHIDTWRDGKKGTGYVTLKELRTFLKAAGLYTKQSFKRWKDDGVEAGYWTHARAEKRLHYRGLKAVAHMLMKCLPDDVIADFRGNQAMGGRMVWVDARGNLAKFKGQILGAWLEQRARDENGLTIQNQTIADMWSVSVRAVQHWREAAHIPHVVNYTETEDTALPIRRIANTYFSPDDTREHSHTGQSSKVRQLANRELTERGFSPDSYGDVGEAKQHRLTFIDSPKMTALEALLRYRDKHGKPHGQAQHARTGIHTVKSGVIALHVEVI